MSTTPTTPQWAIEAAKEMLITHTIPIDALVEDCAAIILKHAPHLSQREPGDSELLDWLEKTEHDLVFECGDPDVGAFSAWQVWRNAKWQDGRPLMVAFDGSLRAAIKSAQRGEGKP